MSTKIATGAVKAQADYYNQSGPSKYKIKQSSSSIKRAQLTKTKVNKAYIDSKIQIKLQLISQSIKGNAYKIKHKGYNKGSKSKMQIANYQKQNRHRKYN